MMPNKQYNSTKGDSKHWH